MKGLNANGVTSPSHQTGRWLLMMGKGREFERRKRQEGGKEIDVPNWRGVPVSFRAPVTVAGVDRDLSGKKVG